MKKQNINKLKLFFMGLESRFGENENIFKELSFKFKTGLKEFKGIGKYEDGKIKYNFNGKTNIVSFKEMLDSIARESEEYDVLELIYSERGNNVLISADNKNVTMKNVQVTEKDDGEKTFSKKKEEKIKEVHGYEGGTSTLLNRDYYIKVGKADSLLKEIGIMSKEGKVKNDKIRKYNQIDHYVELLDKMFDNLPKNKVVTVLDCGCGKSYLSFVLNYYLTEVKRIKCHFIGLDYSEGVIESSRNMAEHLGYRNMEFHAIDIKDYRPDRDINVVLSLHACDTATDMALATGIRVQSDMIIAVPCCHREMLSQYSYEPFKSVTRHGVFKARLADILTDSMRALMLEAKGYDVSVVEYISPLETPKNLMIRAIRSKNGNSKAMDEYMRMMSDLNVYPALYKFLNEW